MKMRETSRVQDKKSEDNNNRSIDGISQSVGTTQSAMFGGASARIENYSKDLSETIIPALRMKVGGIPMVVI